jgi:hypothetical protein
MNNWKPYNSEIWKRIRDRFRLVQQLQTFPMFGTTILIHTTHKCPSHPPLYKKAHHPMYI